jgi:hypothetical protein
MCRDFVGCLSGCFFIVSPLAKIFADGIKAGQDCRVTVEVFERFLEQRLCWVDGFPTTGSSGGQRQCPHCRAKWSYRNLERQWKLAREFCLGRRPTEAARRVGLEAHAAGRFFRTFTHTLSAAFLEEIRLGGYHFRDAERANERIVRACRHNQQKLPDKLLVQICFAEMPAEKRFELAFRRLFRDPLRQRVEDALQRGLRRRMRSGCRVP